MTEAKSGFCVHYASTAVVLLRMLGVPARYCTGYMVDNIQGDNLTEVYSTDAHAWFEFFDLKYGWIMGDATPGNATAAGYFDVNALMEEQGIEKKEIPDHKSSDQNGTSTLTTPTPVVTKDPDGATSTPRPTKDASDTNKKEDKGAGSTDDGSGGLSGLFSSLAARIISAVLILLLLLIALRLIYTRLWRRAMNNENINKRARAYYRYFAMMSGKWKGRPSSHASFIAQKAAFSAGGISEDELELLVRSGKNGLLGIKNKQPWYRRVPVSLLWEVKI